MQHRQPQPPWRLDHTGVGQELGQVTADRRGVVVEEAAAGTDLAQAQLPVFEFLDRMRDDGIATPVVMLTGTDTDESVLEGYQRGAQYYLTKPFKPQALVNIVDFLIGDLDEKARAELEAKL